MRRSQRPLYEGARELAIVSVPIGLLALAVITPFFFKGNFWGHDFDFHVPSWMDVARQWHEGVLYPRWAALANYGFGEPRFIFYPPASWMLGAFLSLLLPWKMVPSAYIWIALVLAGLSMYRLAREWLEVPSAVGAAVLFAANPYHLLIIYKRSDFAELLASAVFPLLLLEILNLTRESKPRLIALPIIIAFIWLTNAPAGVIATYSAALLLVVAAVSKRSVRPLVYGLAGIALGMALAGFYIIPAAVEQPWVRITEVLSSGLRPQDNFLYTVTPNRDHTAFNLLASRMVVATFVLLTLGMGFGGGVRLTLRPLREMLAIITLICIVLVAPVSGVLWTYLPKLRFVQFPWRWLFPAAVAMAAFDATAIGLRRPRTRILLWTAALGALALSGWRVAWVTWWDRNGVADLQATVLDRGTGYWGTAEYARRGSDNSDLNKNAPRVAQVAPPAQTQRLEAGTLDIQSWYSEHKAFTVMIPRPVTLGLRLLNYPAWRIHINGGTVAARSSPRTGQVLIDVPAGISHIRLDFIRTPDRTWGAILSFIALIVWGLLLWRARAPSQKTAGRVIPVMAGR